MLVGWLVGWSVGRSVGRSVGVTRLGEDWLATSWPTTWVKVLRLCFPMTYDADLLEAAVTLVVIVKSSWSAVEIIVQASDDIIKVVPKMKTRSSDLCP